MFKPQTLTLPSTGDCWAEQACAAVADVYASSGHPKAEATNTPNCHGKVFVYDTLLLSEK